MVLDAESLRFNALSATCSFDKLNKLQSVCVPHLQTININVLPTTIIRTNMLKSAGFVLLYFKKLNRKYIIFFSPPLLYILSFFTAVSYSPLWYFHKKLSVHEGLNIHMHIQCGAI